jgi:DNA-binding beta-propeller fold protein YncE
MAKKFLFLSIVCLGLMIAADRPGSAVAAANDGGPFEVAETFHIGGKGNFDYVTVDSQRKLLYIPRTTHTQVLDLSSGKVVADIPGQEGNHGVALNRQAGRGFISDGPGFVVIFDINTHAVLGKVQVDRGADGIINDRASKKVFVSCGGSGTVVPVPVDVDPASGKADPAINVGGKPEYLAADGQGRIFVNLEDKDQVAVIDSKAMKVVDKWSIAPGGTPVGMQIDPEHHRLFVGCRKPQKLIVLNTEDGHVLADLPIGAGCDAVKFDAGNIFASCREGVLNVAKETSPGKFEIIQTLKTRVGAKTMALDHATHSIYLPTAEFGEATGTGRRGRPRAKPESFMVLVVRPAQK